MRHDPHSGHCSGFFLDLIVFIKKTASDVNLSPAAHFFPTVMVSFVAKLQH